MSVGKVDFRGYLPAGTPVEGSAIQTAPGVGIVRRPVCPSGHVKSEVGVATNRQCRACRRKQQRSQMRWVGNLRRQNQRSATQ